MAQIRFQIGVPRAGSAARDAESAREDVRSLRPEAGSAARQAEQERREAQRSGVQRMGRTTLRMQAGARGSLADVARPIRSHAETEGLKQATTGMQEARTPGLQNNLEDQETPTGVPAVPSASAVVVGKQMSQDKSPLQTAAAQFRSLFRSIFPRADGGN